ncbi:hypothetical protein HEK616_68310 [Streptomyces nigrescens]|uniref:Transposase n=1 Tax=Streptomyces nigrescens TaxID=1920 RepID=A0ABM8A438_STRNI|nr:hypothetical protein HEK616_68310 [Streptomyces nigrescens]
MSAFQEALCSGTPGDTYVSRPTMKERGERPWDTAFTGLTSWSELHGRPQATNRGRPAPTHFSADTAREDPSIRKPATRPELRAGRP